MREFVFQPSRTRNGKVTKSQIWYGEYMLEGDAQPTRLSLRTKDKRIAQKRLAEIVRQAERERANLVLPRTLVEAAAKPVSEHIEDYLRDLRSTGRAKEYTRQISARLRRLQSEIGWKILKDMTPESFIAWRDRQKMSPATKNHFHDAVRGFANWLLDHRRMEVNLFLPIKRAQIPKGSRGNHRSLSVDEVRRLIAAAPSERALVYLLAVTTGLRHAELRRLNWVDIRLDANPPHIYFPGDSAKNKRPATLVLTEEAANQLRSIHPGDRATGRVFSGGMPSHHTFNADLKAAGIPKQDHLARSVSFHTLRRTLVTTLHLVGVDRRTAMEINRHTSSQLTDVIYTDSEALPKADAIRRLPSFMAESGEYTEKRTEALDAAGRDASSRVANHADAESSQVPENTRHRRIKTGSDATCQNPSKSGAGGNRTPVPR